MTDQRVYIVDDDEAMRDSLAWLLESHGFAVTACPSADAISTATDRLFRLDDMK